MKKTFLKMLIGIAPLCTFVACDDEEKLSNESSLISFTVSNGLVNKIDVDADKISVYVPDTLTSNEIAAIKISPKIEVSNGATIVPASNTEVALTDGLKFTVTAENNKDSKVYPVEIVKYGKYTFEEEWPLNNDEMTEENGFHRPAYYRWDTSNTGIFFIKMMMSQVDIPYVATRVEDGKNLKYSALIQTADTQGADLGAFFPKIPKITSGSLFTGSFLTDIANTLNSTKFGIPYIWEPVELNVTFKYKAGSVYYNCPDAANANVTEVVENKSDEYSIAAVLYEVEKEDDVLTGVDINTSDKVILRAESFGKTTDWTTLNLKFEQKNGKSYDASKKYKLALVFSSSRWGDTFSGAPGSALTIECIEVISK
ncbi:MAG: PCMD domain-containing protein [Bacteroidales bacterium]|nr:PCMD domain-containing protein [Bacteroidales bacterium]